MEWNKTNTESNIRLLDVPKRIIEKYKELSKDGHVFPVPGNSRCNVILKELSRQCGFKIRLTYHVARHETVSLFDSGEGSPAPSALHACTGSFAHIHVRRYCLPFSWEKRLIVTGGVTQTFPDIEKHSRKRLEDKLLLDCIATKLYFSQ